MSKAYDRMVAARREFTSAWALWLYEADTGIEDVVDERDGTVSIMDQFIFLSRFHQSGTVDIQHVCSNIGGKNHA